MSSNDASLDTEGRAAYHLVAPIEVVDREMIADLDSSKVSTRLSMAIDRMPAGLHRGDLYAVWDFPDARPNPREAAEQAREERPARILVHVGGGELLQLADGYRLHLLIKEG